MQEIRKVRLIGKRYNGQEGIIIGANNHSAFVVLKHKINNSLQGYIRVEVNMLDIEII